MNITIRISEEMAAELEKRRGDQTKAAFYREALEAYMRSGTVSNLSKNEYTLGLEDQVKYLRRVVDDLLRIGKPMTKIEGKLKKRARELLETSPHDKPEPKSKPRRKTTGIFRSKRGRVHTGQPSTT